MHNVNNQEVDKALRSCHPNIPINEWSRNIFRRYLKSTLNCKDRSRKTPHDYQLKVIDFMMQNRGLIVFHKVGSGKTLTAVIVSQCYLDKYKTHRVVVIAPAGLIANFKKEMMTSYGNIRHEDRYHFYSFDKFSRDCKTGTVIDCKNTLLIIDEGHNLRTPHHVSKSGKETGIHTRDVTRCAEKANKVMILTGTPLFNSKDDIVTLYNMIKSPNSPPKTKTNFDEKLMHCKISFHDTASSTEFPKRVNHIVDIPMTPGYEAKYNRLVEDIKNGGIADALTLRLFGNADHLEAFHNGLRRGVNNLEDRNSRKIQWVIEKIVDSGTENSPSLVFSHFLDAGNRIIAATLTELGIPFAFINGTVTMKEREDIVKDYNSGKLQVLLLSKAGGEGLDLKNTQNIIILEPSWNISSQEQVVGRGVRYKSHADLPAKKRVVNVYYLYHLKNDDLKLSNKIKDYLKRDDPEEIPPVDTDDNSIDLVMRTFIARKQQTIDKHLKTLISHSIENNSC